MRTLYVFNLITLDGYFEGANHDISWHNVDDELREFAVEQLNETSTLLFGRLTYELMASFWPTPDAIKNDPIVAAQMNSTEKVAFSGTMAKTGWNNTRLVKENAELEISKMKKEDGGNIGILGSGKLVASLARTGLIDEYRFMVNPVAIGRGTSMFDGMNERMKLNLIDVRKFKSGNVLLCYSPGTTGRI